MRSAGTRFFVVGLLALFMFVPLFFAGSVIEDRARYARQAADGISEEWGGAQVLQGMELRIPVEETVTTTRRVGVVDPATGAPRLSPDGQQVTRLVEESAQVAREPVHLLPRRYDVTVATRTETRRRGLFDVPVYRADGTFAFDFDLDRVATVLPEGHVPVWERASLRVGLASNRSLRGAAALTADAATLDLQP
ncbi:MAG: inner membrane CreD family protein, partial [Shimia sp.]